ncbi:hypothetical protein CerSpe_108360 [Prunus speciosa]
MSSLRKGLKIGGRDPRILGTMWDKLEVFTINFAAFDKQKILRFAKFYPQEFNDRDLMKLEDQLGLYIVDMQSSTEFSSLNGITDLAEKLVNTGRSRIYNYVYLLVTLALVLPVATA